jgi:hypothetical protein
VALARARHPNSPLDNIGLEPGNVIGLSRGKVEDGLLAFVQLDPGRQTGRYRLDQSGPSLRFWAH